MDNIIIAYHRGDEELAQTYQKLLKQRGYMVELDPNAFSHAQPWNLEQWTEKTSIILVTTQLVDNFPETQFRKLSVDEINDHKNRFNIDLVPVILENACLSEPMDRLFSVNLVDQKPEETVETVCRFFQESTPPALFQMKKKLTGLSISLLVLSVFSYALVDLELWPDIYVVPSMIIFFGMLGALTYILFNVLGIISEKDFHAPDIYSNYLRLLLGGITGWVFYILLKNSPYYETNLYSFGLSIAFAFLSGFSSRLVIGILNQLIQAVERMIGVVYPITKKQRG